MSNDPFLPQNMLNHSDVTCWLPRPTVRGASRHLKASPRVRITKGMIVSRLNESESEQLMNIGISVAYQPSESMPAAPKTLNGRTDESGSARVLSGGTRDCSCGPRQQRSRKRIETAQATRYLVAAALLHHVPDSVRAPSLLAHRLCRVNIKSTYFATRHFFNCFIFIALFNF